MLILFRPVRSVSNHFQSINLNSIEAVMTDLQISCLNNAVAMVTQCFFLTECAFESKMLKKNSNKSVSLGFRISVGRDTDTTVCL